MNYYLCVNSNPNEYNIPVRTLVQEQFDIHKDPLYFYLTKDKIRPVGWIGDIPVREHHQKVINFLKSKIKNDDEEAGVNKSDNKDSKNFIKRFLNFRK